MEEIRYNKIALIIVVLIGFLILIYSPFVASRYVPMPIVPKRSYHITTNSYHRFRKVKNQLLDLQINKPDQVWVSDITYI